MTFYFEDKGRFLQHSIDQIASTYGDRVEIGAVRDLQVLTGCNLSVGTIFEELSLTGGFETYLTDNLITHISSSDDTDTQPVRIEGLTISGGLMTRIQDTVTLTGQTPLAIPRPMCRQFHLRNIGLTAWGGTVYGYETDTVVAGVPQTAAKIHIQTGGSGVSWKGAASAPQDTYLIFTSWDTSIQAGSNARADFRLEMREVSETLQVFSLLYPKSADTPPIKFEPYMIVPKNSDFRIICKASTNNVELQSTINVVLATVITT